MFGYIAKKIFGTRNDRILKSVKPFVEAVNSLESKLQGLSDPDLTSKTTLFKERLNKGESLDEIAAEAFAVVREAAKRTLSMRHFDVQLIGGSFFIVE